MREISGGEGSFSQNDLRPNFGLGNATNVETLRIEWPSGQVQELANVPVNQTLILQEPPRLEPTVKVLNGMVELKVLGWKGFTYAIEASSDLKTWTRLGTVQNLTGTLQATDADAGGPRRFYRLVVP
ncbi:MAG: ASPIC/UnbV domain-containing protein [Chloroflexi bacterium]|nr:ASPIC/UnbV domain-containing protein [Chloroflexota bacterium]